MKSIFLLYAVYIGIMLLVGHFALKISCGDTETYNRFRKLQFRKRKTKSGFYE